MIAKRQDGHFDPSLHRILTVVALIATGVACGVTTEAFAQDYPTKPIRVIVPLAPGGGTDIAARVTGQKLSERWGQQVIVDNRAGGASNIGTREIVVNSAPDGYTVLSWTNPAPIVVNQWLFAKLPFDPVKDLVPVTMVAPTFYVLMTHPSGPRQFGTGTDRAPRARCRASSFSHPAGSARRRP